MEPVQNNPEPTSPIPIQQQPNIDSPKNYPHNPLKKFALPALLFVLLFIIIIQSLALTKTLGSNKAIENAKPIKKEGEFPQFRKGFENSITVKPVNFLPENYYTTDYRVSNTAVKIDDVVQIGCSDWEPAPYNPNHFKKEPVKTLNIVYGVIGKGDFWSATFIPEDIEVGRTYFLPIYIEDEPPKYGRVYGLVDFQEYDSTSYDTIGTITLNKFEGCDIGDKIEFSLNTIIGNSDTETPGAEYIGLQIMGDFQGEVNVENGKNPFTPLISEEEFKTYLKKYEETSGKRKQEIESKYYEEYDDDYYDEYAYDDKITPPDSNALKRDEERKKHITIILNSIGAYAADNSGALPSGITAEERELSSYELDLCEVLVPAYLPALPVDPAYKADYRDGITNCSSLYETGYLISKDSNNRVTVDAFMAEGETEILITR